MQSEITAQETVELIYMMTMMNIMNIEIELITKQYMDFLDSQEKMNLEVSSEYLVLASELLEIKSRLLLPNNKVDENGEEVVEDPREELVNRLLEYQTYKNITSLLQEKELLRKDIYTKSPENIKNYVNESFNYNYTLDNVIEVAKKVKLDTIYFMKGNE